MSTDGTVAGSEDPAASEADRTAVSDADPASLGELRGQIDVLEAENERLRREYVRARQTGYRRTALGLFVTGIVGIVGGAVFPGPQNVLIALGGSAIVVGILTYYLTPESFVTVAVGDAVVSTLQNSYESIRSELDLAGDPVYVPVPEDTRSGARLFLPQHHDHEIPDADSLRETFVVTEARETRGASLYPTGGALLEEFRNATDLPHNRDSNPERVFERLGDGLVEQFELAEQVRADIESDDRCIVAVEQSRSGRVERVDHPIPSFLAVGAATAFGQPVRVDVAAGDSDEYVIECRWGPQVEETGPEDG